MLGLFVLGLFVLGLPVLGLFVTTLARRTASCAFEGDPEVLVRAAPPAPVLDDPPVRAWPSAVSSFDTVLWSLETTCSSEETVSRAASHVAWPAGVAVLALVQSDDWACARSAASCCWSFDSVVSSWVSVVWS